MSLKSDLKYFSVAGNEYGLNPQDMNGRNLVSLEEAEEDYEEILEDGVAVALFKIEDKLITLVKSECIM